MKRAIIYTRVSSDEQKKNNSLSAQRDDGLDYAQKQGFTVIDVMSEDFTGISIDRPLFTRLLEMGDANLIEVVIVQHADRLGRGLALEMAIALLMKRGVEVHACNRGLISDQNDESSQLQNNVDSLVSGEERHNIKRRTQRGLIQKVAEGKIHGCGGAPFGYYWEGKGAKRTLVVLEEEAKTVRLIFELYDSGMSVLEIVRKLEKLGVPSPSALPDSPRNGMHRKQSDTCHWVRAVVNRILRRRTYIGEYLAFKTHTWRHANKQITPIMNDTMIFEVESIVSKDLFEAVQIRLSSRKSAGRSTRKSFYLLRQLLRCECGYRMSGCDKGRAYRCCASQHKHDVTKPCNTGAFKVKDVDYTVWLWICEHVLNEEVLRDGIEQKRKKLGSERDRLTERGAYYIERIITLEKDSDRLDDLLNNGLFTLEEVSKEKRKIENNRKEMTKECDQVNEQIQALGVPVTREKRLLDLVRQIEAEERPLTNDRKREVVELLGIQGVLYQKNMQPWCRINVDIVNLQADVPVISPPQQGTQMKMSFLEQN
jgi:site-specific DNA recombinase